MIHEMTLLLLLATPVPATTAQKPLSLEQAQSLARAAAEEEGLTRMRGFALENGRMEEFPAFYFFDAIVAAPGAEGFSGHYAVDKFTCEVWDPYKCSRLTGPNLSQLQRKLRAELGITNKRSRQHRRDSPCLTGRN